ncbi:MAG: hypothetical protein FD151_2067 [bacterium]|nr:MAG: hypothetical protein FD151_2067 [bacterium]
MGNIEDLYTQQRSLRRELYSTGNLIKGSLVTLTRRCGKPNCKCTRGERHQGLFLSFNIKQKSHLLYIPKKLIKKITAMVNNHKKLRQIVDELSKVNREIIVLEKRNP